jgi:heat shock protein HspQ
MANGSALFFIGQLVTHLKFRYRGVVSDVDPVFSESEEWYERVAQSRPPKDQPWYHVLVDGAAHTTYVAERHLTPDESGHPVTHPLCDALFDGMENGSYRPRGRRN